MGSIWLDGRTAGYKPLDQVIRDAGLTLLLWDGWQYNSRSSGGFEQLLGTVCHHTAGSATGSFQNDWAYHAVGHPDSPVANMLLGRQGQVGLHAAGASNHAGKGGPWQGSKGVVPLDSANSRMLGIEAQNTGTGEYWPEVMMDAYERLLAAINNAYGLNPMMDEPAHFQWAPGRKIDPWGGNQSTVGYPYTGPHSWNMNGFNQNVAGRMAGIPHPPNGEEDDDSLIPIYKDVVRSRVNASR